MAILSDPLAALSSFLRASGLEVVSIEGDRIHGRQLLRGYEYLDEFVWAPTLPTVEDVGRALPGLLREFERNVEEYPSARRYLVLDSRAGLTKAFQREAVRLNVAVRTVIEYVDTPFSWETNRSAAEDARSLVARSSRRGAGPQGARAPRRVSQPFDVLGGESSGPDLAPTLTSIFTSGNRDERPLHVVSGPAGMGKSLLVSHVLGQLADRFTERKNRQERARRPLPLMPTAGGAVAGGLTAPVSDLLRRTLDTTFARQVSPETFEWLLTHGFASWILDGLDEVIARDPDFFDRLADLLSLRAEYPPLVLICVRDSLLTSSTMFREFLEAYDDQIVHYRLRQWNAHQIEAFAEVNVGDAERRRFLSLARGTSGISNLVSLPYYCHLLALTLPEIDDSPGLESATDLLELALTQILQREIDKGVFGGLPLDIEDMVALLEELAGASYRGALQGVTVESVRDWAALVVPENCSSDEADRFVVAVSQLALFSQGAHLGQLRFAQEVMEQYLLGRHLRSILKTDIQQLCRVLSSLDLPPDSLALRILSSEVRRGDHTDELLNAALGRPLDTPTTFRNLLRVCMLAAPSHATLFKDANFQFENRDLQGLRFSGYDLSDLSFRKANLSEVEFIDCDLRGSVLVDAVLWRTRLDISDDQLKDAAFGNLSGFRSIIPRGFDRSERDATRAAAWLAERTRVRTPLLDPCPAARQLQHFFNKFVHPNGDIRRTWIDRQAAERGKRYLADVTRVIDASAQAGFVTERAGRDIIDRVPGDAWTDIIRYATHLHMSERVRKVLEECCDDRGCEHVPEVMA